MSRPPSSSTVPELRTIPETHVTEPWLRTLTTDEIGFERPVERAVGSIFWIVLFGVGGIAGITIPVVYGGRYDEVAGLGLLSFGACAVAVWWWKRFVHRRRITGVEVRVTTKRVEPGGSFDVIVDNRSGIDLAIGVVVEDFRIWGFLERPSRSNRRERKFLVRTFHREAVGAAPIRVHLGADHPLDLSSGRHQIATYLRLVPTSEAKRVYIGSMRTKLDVRIHVTTARSR
ncbi:MAG: hypothetical protein ABJH68_20470 [Ilumatobacter sp.]|uniref:hypothetical protein n=2 Tax=Ilumatobacter sp. TaxID=1967498 RepID=UPI0032979881